MSHIFLQAFETRLPVGNGSMCKFVIVNSWISCLIRVCSTLAFKGGNALHQLSLSFTVYYTGTPLYDWQLDSDYLLYKTNNDKMLPTTNVGMARWRDHLEKNYLNLSYIYIFYYKSFKFKHVIDDIIIDLWSFWNFTSMENIIRTCNPIVRFSKFIYNKNM